MSVSREEHRALIFRLLCVAVMVVTVLAGCGRAESVTPAPSLSLAPPVPAGMEELPPEKRRKTHLLTKGNFLDPGEQVEPGVPAAFHPLPPGVPPDRLGVGYARPAPEALPLLLRV